MPGRIAVAAGGETGGLAQLHVMRYMGGKAPLLPFLLPPLLARLQPGEIVVDLMAGTHAVGYALKERQRLIANDVQHYSATIGQALLASDGVPFDAAIARQELAPAWKVPLPTEYRLFSEVYADTYLSAAQCDTLDRLRFAIDRYGHPDRRALYLTALIYAVCYVQSTTGHFAQFLPKEHPRLAPLRRIPLTRPFLAKCDELAHRRQSPFPQRVTRQEYGLLLTSGEIPSEVRLFYADPPYTADQYSRFYHFLETLVLYDHPTVTHRGRYRQDRFRSAFSSRRHVAAEFRRLVDGTAAFRQAILALSYAASGLLPIEAVLAICRSRYRCVTLLEQSYRHSSLGKGAASAIEFLVIAEEPV